MYEDRTAETIRDEMLDDLQEQLGLTTQPGGYLDTIIGRAATEIAKVYATLEGLTSMLFVDESSEGFLDLHGETYYNMPRKNGSAAQATMTFSGDPGMVIPAGTAFLTADGLEFNLLDDVTLGSSGKGIGQVQAAGVGIAYNVAADALTRMYVNLSGLTEWHNATASGGSDRETGDAYFARIDERRKRPPTSGNVHHYRQWALEVPGVGAAKVVPLSNGPGTVGILVVGTDMSPAGVAIVGDVATHIDAERPIGPSVIIAAPAPIAINVTAAVELGRAGDVETVAASFGAELAVYLRDVIEAKYSAVYAGPSEDVAYKVLYNRVAALLMGVDGVDNYTALTLSGSMADVTIAAGAVPVLGEVSVTCV